MPAREKTRHRTRGNTDDEFVVFLQGIPAHCRWQELKDLVRQTALHIRQAVVYDDHHGFPTGLGQIIVKNEEEAWRTYRPTKSPFFPSAAAAAAAAAAVASSSPSVSSASSASASVGVSASAGASATGYTPVSGYTTPPSMPQQLGISSPEPYLPTPDYTPMINLPPFIAIYPDLDPMYFYPPPPPAATAPTPGLEPGAVTPTPTPAGPGAVAYPQAYPSTPTPGTPTPTPTPYRPKSFQNTSIANTKQTRTILIQNLSPTVSQHDLCAVFTEAGPIESSHVDTNPKNGSSTTGAETVSPTGTGTATTARITYTSVEAAKRAVALFNSASLGPDLPLCPGSKRLRVRLERFPAYVSGSGSGSASAPGREKDKETTVETGRPRDCQSLVVNGSGVGKRALIA